jgi:hypothetical protein
MEKKVLLAVPAEPRRGTIDTNWQTVRKGLHKPLKSRYNPSLCWFSRGFVG